MAKKKKFRERIGEVSKKAIGRNQRALADYRRMRKDEPLNEKAVLLESQQGRTANGNLFYIAKELRSNPDYSFFSVGFVVKETNIEAARSLFAGHGIDGIEFIVINSPEYIKLLATAKYLVTDTSFPTYYTKRQGQVVWNTWHGTPLKTMGKKDAKALHDLGNVQKNFILADYLSYPNEYTREHMVEDYMLENLAKGKTAICGYPRNTAFFDKESAARLRENLGIEARRVYAYMPTWRPRPNGIPARYGGAETMHYLMLLDDLLEDSEIMYVNVHPLARKNVYFRAFAHIKQFPSEYETYEFLNCCDVLVTDYSSVMFDYACSRKKIVLFDYDRHLYLRDRGLYASLDTFPFPHAKTPEELIEELRKPKEYDDSSFVAGYCHADSAHATADLCRSILGGSGNLDWEPIKDNGKEKILIYAGNLAQNGITASLSALLNTIDREERNYFLTFTTRSVAPNKEYLSSIPDGVAYIPRKGGKVLTFSERLVRYLYRRRRIPFGFYERKLEKAYSAEYERNYGGIDFDHVVQFNGYDYEIIMELAGVRGDSVIYVHSDMEMEEKTRGNVRLDVLEYAYGTYEKTAIVSQGIQPATSRIAKGRGNIIVTPNCFDYRRIREKALADIAFDKETSSNLSEAEVRSFLADGNTIISIGRFSPEKQHRLLISAFNEVWAQDKTAKLAIVGGVSKGNTYQETLDYANSLPCHNNIVLIKRVSNPYPILAASKGLILSSKYEGHGLVLLEAAALGKPVVSTDIQGPRGFMTKYKGMLVENSTEGVKAGISALISGDAPQLDIDFRKYNETAREAFYSLLES